MNLQNSPPLVMVWLVLRPHSHQHGQSLSRSQRTDSGKNVLSVQAQDSYPLRTLVDQRGEQTINRNAKTSGKNLLLFSFN